MLHLKKDLFLVNLNVLSSNLQLIVFFLQATDFMPSLKEEKQALLLDIVMSATNSYF